MPAQTHRTTKRRSNSPVGFFRGGIAFSAQVLQEFFVAAVGKERLGITRADALDVLKALKKFPVCPVTYDLILHAAQLQSSLQLSYWDAAIIAAAKQMGCRIVFSEDLNDGQHYNGVEVVNPFIQTL